MRSAEDSIVRDLFGQRGSAARGSGWWVVSSCRREETQFWLPGLPTTREIVSAQSSAARALFHVFVLLLDALCVATRRFCMHVVYVDCMFLLLPMCRVPRNMSSTFDASTAPMSTLEVQQKAACILPCICAISFVSMYVSCIHGMLSRRMRQRPQHDLALKQIEGGRYLCHCEAVKIP